MAIVTNRTVDRGPFAIGELKQNQRSWLTDSSYEGRKNVQIESSGIYLIDCEMGGRVVPLAGSYDDGFFER